MRPRVWFGTMHSGEAEFARSSAAIAGQTGLSEIKHYVVSGMPEAKAHNALWSAWESEKANYDLFVKVDADTVIDSTEAVSRVWEMFAADPRVTGAQLKLHDYFTDDLIAGLNFFTPVVVFNVSPELYCDRVDTNHNVVLKGEPVSHLEPVGLHCIEPNDSQAFHFGLHRMLKDQTDVMKRTFDVWKTKRDRPRSLALFGASMAYNAGERFMEASSYDTAIFQSMMKIVNTSSIDYFNTMIDLLATRMGWQ